MNNKVRIGILGCGPRGMQMGRIVKLMPEYCQLTAMSDPAETALAQAKQVFPEIRHFTHSDALLDSGVMDAVITEIPPAVHSEYVIKALERGIHVLGEIPVVDSLEEGELLWEKVRQSKALYMCGSNPHYRAKTGFVLKMDEMGLLGNIAYIETEYMHYMLDLTDQWRKTYESCRYCTHSLGPVLALLKNDEFVSVSCMSTGDHYNSGRSHNAMAALLRTRNNVVVRFLTGFATPYHGPAHTTKIFAEKGIVELYNEKARVWLAGLNDFSARNDFIEIPLTPQVSDRPRGIRIDDEEVFRLASCGHNGSDNRMLQDFAQAILQGKPSPIGIREGLAMTLPGIYAALSAREGGTLKEIHYPWNT
ncbi:MAG: Gfo/Idh/MocA family oxidoreductase [Lentisphaeria bacterium]